MGYSTFQTKNNISWIHGGCVVKLRESCLGSFEIQKMPSCPSFWVEKPELKGHNLRHLVNLAAEMPQSWTWLLDALTPIDHFSNMLCQFGRLFQTNPYFHVYFRLVPTSMLLCGCFLVYTWYYMALVCSSLYMFALPAIYLSYRSYSLPIAA